MKLIRIIVLLCFTFNSLIVFAADNVSLEPEELDPAEQVFAEIYKAWNEHDAEKLFTYYSSDFVTGDGINKKDYRALTEALWKAYPDIKVENQKRTVRSQDQYSTISGIDFFYGQSVEENKDLAQKGVLNAISQGQLFLQKFGKEWKVVSDKIQFELVTVYYGNAKSYLDEHQVFFSSPEQIKAGEQYSATLYSILPENVKATATINKDLIQKPDDTMPNESFQMLSEHKLERLFASNENNYNELVSATVIFSKGLIEPKLDGILYISKRVNVTPKIKSKENDLVVDKSFAETFAKKDDKKKETDSKSQPKVEEDDEDEDDLE